MSKQTAGMRKIIDAAKAGDQESLQFCRDFMVRIAQSDYAPAEVIIEVSEVILRHGFEQGRRDAEQN